MAKHKQQQEEVVQNGKMSMRDAALAVVRELNAPATLSELTALALERYVQAGGEADAKTMRDYVKSSVQAAAAFGLVKVQKPTDLVVTPIKD